MRSVSICFAWQLKVTSVFFSQTVISRDGTTMSHVSHCRPLFVFSFAKQVSNWAICRQQLCQEYEKDLRDVYVAFLQSSVRGR
jgi:hypothetical protein